MTHAFRQRPQITLETAQRLINAAVENGAAAGSPIAVAVTDAAGHVIASARMDEVPLGAMKLALDRAYTSVLWQMPSGDLHETSQPGGDDWGVTSTEQGRIVVYAGGFPVFSDGMLAGAIGVSGGTGEQDAACASVALAAVLGDG